MQYNVLFLKTQCVCLQVKRINGSEGSQKNQGFPAFLRISQLFWDRLALLEKVELLCDLFCTDVLRSL